MSFWLCTILSLGGISSFHPSLLLSVLTIVVCHAATDILWNLHNCIVIQRQLKCWPRSQELNVLYLWTWCQMWRMKIPLISLAGQLIDFIDALTFSPFLNFDLLCSLSIMPAYSFQCIMQLLLLTFTLSASRNTSPKQVEITQYWLGITHD